MTMHSSRTTGLTTNQMMVLAQVRRLGQISVRQIVGATAMDEPDVETALRKLQAIGVVSEHDGARAPLATDQSR
jgi:DNA-binding MarR family transcriptional regulator